MSAQVFEMSRDIDGMLAERKFPFPFYYVPERAQIAQTAPTQIHFMRSREATDLVGAPQGQQKNPRKVYTRRLAVDVIVYAAATDPGAMLQEHEGLCDQIVDALVCAIDTWCTHGKAGEPEYLEMRYLSAAELGGLEAWPGVVYLLRFRIGRGVTAKTYLGEAKPTAAIQNIDTSYTVALAPEVVE